MEKKEIFRRKQLYEQELSAYTGDDPLKLRYDFISWLDGTYGKENVMDTFFPVLEETLHRFWKSIQYHQDPRFIQLLITYIGMQDNPTDLYKRFYGEGIGSENPLFYTNWANSHIKKEQYKKANDIFKLGFSKDKIKSELQNSYDQFLQIMGKKHLSQCIESQVSQNICAKCLNSFKKNEVSDRRSENGENQDWELNPLKPGEPDDFKCPLVVHDPPDANKIPMYPKKMVYCDGKEYSLEEIRARRYLQELKTMGDPTERRDPTLQKDDLNREECKENIINKNHVVDVENVKCEPYVKELMGKEKGIQEECAKQHVSPPKNSAFQKPLLLHDSLHVTQTSYTAHMKEAMNVVQEMWSSPTPSESNAVSSKSRTLYKSSEPPKETSTNENCGVVPISKRTLQFSVYTEEDKEPVNCAPTPNGPAMRPSLLPRAMTSIKKDSRQMGEFNSVGIKQQLPFSYVPNAEDNDMLATKLGEVSMANTQKQQNRMPVTILPAEQNDFNDETCNTKAFNFSLPSSTPIQNKKFSGARTSLEQPQDNVEDVPSKLIHKNNPELSMILEASKERYSNSSSSNNGCVNRAQSSAPLQSELGSRQFSPDQPDIDPFCPKLIEKLLNTANFPQSYQAENYYVFNTSLPSLGKNLKLGNDVYTVVGDIGKGAYARIIKATVKSKTFALKVEKPACKWEYYICKEIQNRVDPAAKSCFMNIKNAFIFNNGSILETEWAQYGSLLNVSNHYKVSTGKVLDNTVVLHFAIELVDIMDYLHQCNIIHADIKPDNFVVRSLPSTSETKSCIQLIDFGRSIDMKLLPPRTQFTTVVKTDGFTCCEMKERRPWTYQTDLYGLAATIYCLIFGEYMAVEKKNNTWKLLKQFPRNVRKLWEPIFSALLNIESCDQLPNMVVIRSSLEEVLSTKDKFLLTQNYRALENIMKGK